MAPIRQVSKQVTQERIICAAVDVFSTCGYHGSSLRNIARQANVNEVTLFRYFPRKLDLFVAAVQTAASQIRFPQGLQCRLLTGDHPSAIFGLVFDYLVDMAVSHPEILRLVSFAALESQLSASVVRDSLRPLSDSLSGYLESCMKKGTVRELDPDVLSEALMLTVIMQLACAATMGQKVDGHDRWRLPGLCNSVWLDGIVAD